MLAKFTTLYIMLLFLISCENTPPGPSLPVADVVNEDGIEKCSFQMQGIQNLVGGKHKLVTGYRRCENVSSATKELVVFGEGESINNSKECNLFATTDTTLTWSTKLSPLLIEVIFHNRLPADSTLIMKANTVYDSIEVIYSINNTIEG